VKAEKASEKFLFGSKIKTTKLLCLEKFWFLSHINFVLDQKKGVQLGQLWQIT
jgi:hypothetical protein